MAALMQLIASEAEGEVPKRHAIIPMNRLLNNQDVFNDNVAPWKTNDARLQDLDIISIDAPEEPQVGFRWDSPVSYQPSMRYGRRSKLELLWRLGAIPFSRGLHIKRLPWEKQDHLYITPHSYASAVKSSASQQQTKDGITDGDFVKAGWVHRLFSGDTSQEYSTTRAAELRRLNRMRGIITYLENLDLKASQIQSGAADSLQDRMWHWDVRDLKDAKRAVTEGRIPNENLTQLHQASQRLVKRLTPSLQAGSLGGIASPISESVLKDCLHLAAIAYITANHQLVQTAVTAAISLLTDLSAARYTTVLPFGQPPVGYAFPSLPPKLLDSQEQVTLPYDPFRFNIATLIDILRIVRLSGPESILSSAERKWVKDMDSVMARHLQVLLLSKEATDMSSTPPSFESAIAYDRSVLALSAYFGMPPLVSRVQQRHQLRYLDPATGQVAREATTPNITNLYETFKKGLNNVALEFHTRIGGNLSVHSIIEELLSLS